MSYRRLGYMNLADATDMYNRALAAFREGHGKTVKHILSPLGIETAGILPETALRNAATILMNYFSSLKLEIVE